MKKKPEKEISKQLIELFKVLGDYDVVITVSDEGAAIKTIVTADFEEEGDNESGKLPRAPEVKERIQYVG